MKLISHLIRVLDSEQELAARPLGKQVVVQSRAQASKVQEPGRRRRVPHTHRSGHGRWCGHSGEPQLRQASTALAANPATHDSPGTSAGAAVHKPRDCATAGTAPRPAQRARTTGSHARVAPATVVRCHATDTGATPGQHAMPRGDAHPRPRAALNSILQHAHAATNHAQGDRRQVSDSRCAKISSLIAFDCRDPHHLSVCSASDLNVCEL